MELMRNGIGVLLSLLICLIHTHTHNIYIYISYFLHQIIVPLLPYFRRNKMNRHNRRHVYLKFEGKIFILKLVTLIIHLTSGGKAKNFSVCLSLFF